VSFVTKYYRRGGPETTYIYFSQFWRLGSTSASYQLVQNLVKACLIIEDLTETHTVHKIRELSGASFIRALILFPRAPPPCLNHHLKASPLNIIPLGVRIQHVVLGNTDIGPTLYHKSIFVVGLKA
jgi:hypothetical protein